MDKRSVDRLFSILLKISVLSEFLFFSNIKKKKQYLETGQD